MSSSLPSQTVVSDFRTIIDSGTTIVYGPPQAVEKLYARVPGASLWDADNGFYQFPCDAVPADVAFTWGGRSWALSAARCERRMPSVATRDSG